MGFGETRNCQLMKNAGVEEDSSTKIAWDTPLLNIKEERNTTKFCSRIRAEQLWMLRAKTVASQAHLVYNCAGSGHTATCSLQFIHNFSQKNIHQNELVNKNWVLLATWSSESVIKIHIWRRMSETTTQRRNCWC